MPKILVVQIVTDDDARADVRDFEDLHNLVRAAESDGHACSVKQLSLNDSAAFAEYDKARADLARAYYNK